MQAWWGGGAWGAAPQPATGQMPPAAIGTAPLVNTQPRIAGTQILGTGMVGSSITTGVLQPGSGVMGGGGDYKVGEVIEYYSTSQGSWIPAKVLTVNPHGTYDLDCKPDVTPDKMRRQQLGAPVSGDVTYQVGDMVEYFGATQGKWIPAKVLSITSSGNYNLDCKPDVAKEKIRPLSSGGPPGSQQIVADDPGYKVGESVEYMSASQNRWIPAKVTAVNPNGTYNLDCKPDVAPANIRRPQSVPGATGGQFKEGDFVDYYSASQGNWIPAKVLAVNASGTYNLDCKPDVAPDKVRAPSSVGSRPLGSSTALGGGGEPKWKVGDRVEYFGATMGKWIPAKVLAVNANGTYNLDCKPDVPPEKIRDVGSSAGNTDPPAGEAAAVPFKAGDTVEYYGATQNRWITAKVLTVNPSGTYNLDCKPDVPLEKIRRPGSGGTAPPTITSLGTSNNLSAIPETGAWAPSTSYGALGAGITTGPTAASPGTSEQTAPVQLLRVQRVANRWRYEVCPEGAAALERYGSRRIAVVSLCGLYRTGKSFLLNALLERSQRGLPPFRVGSTTQACTEGLWLWGSTDAGEDGPLLAYLDCEGFGSTQSDRTRDAQLMTLCALLSSVLLLNTKGALNERIFDSLALTCKFAEHIEERGNEASRPQLLWVLRDFMLELRDAGGKSIAADEYLEQALHMAGPSGSDSAHGQGAREVRQSLLKFFAHRGCVTLPTPATEESQLQRLDQMPYGQLRPDFRSGVEALQHRLLSATQANPKVVGGQPLGCLSFVALLRQLVTALNDNKILSVRGAWETVQHTTCGALVEELRGQALQTLHLLAAGGQAASGAKLPMTDENLRLTLRNGRRALKSQWERRAVGDEIVREEYWQELKESLARDENMVRQQNTRLADTQLGEAIRAWQDWLDCDDAGRDPAPVEQICRQLSSVMESMPAAPLSRAGRAAIEAAARRVCHARARVKAAMDSHGDAQRQAVAVGEQAAQQEGAAHMELEAKKQELVQALGKLKSKRLQDQTHAAQHEEQSAQLKETKAQLERSLLEAEEVRVTEHDLKAQQRQQIEAETSLQAELEMLRATAAKHNADRLVVERCARQAADTASAEQRRLELEIEQARGENERFTRLLQELRAEIRGEGEKTKQEHMARVEEVNKQREEERKLLHGEHEKTRAEHVRLLDDTFRQLEEERREHHGALESEKDRLAQREHNAGILQGQVNVLMSQREDLKKKVEELGEKAHQSESHLAVLIEENNRAQMQLTQAKQSRDHLQQQLQERRRREEQEARERFHKLEEEKRLAEERKPKCGCSIQ